MLNEVTEYENAEREMEALEAATGKPCKIIAGPNGTYQAVVIGSCAHFDFGISTKSTRETPAMIPDEGIELFA